MYVTKVLKETRHTCIHQGGKKQDRPFRYAKANKDYDMIFETLDRNQILNALISILDKKIDKEKVKKFYYTLNDNSQIKMFIEALGVEDKMVIRCNTLYNL